VYTVIETPLFQKLWPSYWSEEERGEFAAYIAGNASAGDLIKESGGVRIIYFTRTDQGEVVLLTIYAKSKIGNIASAKLKEIRRALEN
jgi:hypothetical protein